MTHIQLILCLRLVRNTKRYEVNYLKRSLYIRECKELGKDWRQTTKWKRMRNIESKLNQIGNTIRKRLGLYIDDPCEQYACKNHCQYIIEGKSCPMNRWDKQYYLENKPEQLKDNLASRFNLDNEIISLINQINTLDQQQVNVNIKEYEKHYEREQEAIHTKRGTKPRRDIVFIPKKDKQSIGLFSTVSA